MDYVLCRSVSLLTRTKTEIQTETGKQTETEKQIETETDKRNRQRRPPDLILARLKASCDPIGT